MGFVIGTVHNVNVIGHEDEINGSCIVHVTGE
jgi:hypothetical protein